MCFLFFSLITNSCPYIAVRFIPFILKCDRKNPWLIIIYISVWFRTALQGKGSDSFADAVNAYNEQYGTNYTVDSAREALGQ